MLLDEGKAAALLQPIVDEAVDRATKNLATTDVPALEAALTRVFDGLTITITISRKVLPNG